MTEKINRGAERDKGSEAVLPGSDETEPSDYDIRMKQLRCRRLELLCEQLELDNNVSASERYQRIEIDANEHQRRRKIGFWVAWIAGTVPVVAVVILFVMLIACPEYFFKEMNFAILFVASFSSMTVIYAFLIRGMFPGVIQKNDANNTHPVVDEAMKVVQSPGGKE